MRARSRIQSAVEAPPCVSKRCGEAESSKKDKGEYEARTEWHRVCAWSNLSKFAKTLQKGAAHRRPRFAAS
jgi:hypothetical protein